MGASVSLEAASNKLLGDTGQAAFFLVDEVSVVGFVVVPVLLEASLSANNARSASASNGLNLFDAFFDINTGDDDDDEDVEDEEEAETSIDLAFSLLGSVPLAPIEETQLLRLAATAPAFRVSPSEITAGKEFRRRSTGGAEAFVVEAVSVVGLDDEDATPLIF